MPADNVGTGNMIGAICGLWKTADRFTQKLTVHTSQIANGMEQTICGLVVKGEKRRSYWSVQQ